MAPRVRVEVGEVRPQADAPGRWLVTWRIHNDGGQPLVLEAAWIPHGRFRGDGRLPLNAEVGPASEVQLTFGVDAREPPQTQVENAFLIVRAREGEHAWRIFSRMRIVFDKRGAPQPSVEAVTLQPVGGGIE